MTHTPPGPLSSPSLLSHEPARAPHEPMRLGHEFPGHEGLGHDFTKHEFLGSEVSGPGFGGHEDAVPGFAGHEDPGKELYGAGSGGGAGTGPPGREVPPTGTVPLFPPLPPRCAGLGRLWPRRHAGRGLALALLALCGGLLLAVPSMGADAPPTKAAPGPQRLGAHTSGTRPAPDRRPVRTAVRIAEPAGLRLVRPGDRVDVIAVSGTGPRAARVVVAGARVVALPRPPGSTPSPSRGTATSLTGTSPESAGVEVWPEPDAETRWDATDSGAVIVLTVPRASAVDLAAASASSTLAVVAC
ncbi:hypothetical protein ACIP5N_02435 [Streptomyces sp. NPDC088768]|uniref:hypothetical protein n=1 Tax=Streptomyces sp. NPDC088768 TaxID=3365894 RepID=UPI00380EA12C